jgi:hypothetical protein
MSAIKNQTGPIASAWMLFYKQGSPGNSAKNIAAFTDFLLLKEKI